MPEIFTVVITRATIMGNFVSCPGVLMGTAADLVFFFKLYVFI